MPEFDLVIRGGTIVDGNGGEPYVGDVAISGREIAQVGAVTGKGREEIDAAGKIVTPGFVDVHTHYDAQVTWDEHITPNSHHGFTTVVFGNCAIGIAPCRPDDHDLLISVVEGVEDIPEAVIAAGVPWKWQTFPEYLDFLETRRTDIDFAAMVAHAPIRVWVMGERAARREMSNKGEQAEMQRLVVEAVEAGALGVSCSRTTGHRTTKGDLAPAETAAESELLSLARGLNEAGGGVFMINTDFADTEAGEDSADFNLLKRLARTSGSPVFYLLMEYAKQPHMWREALALTAQANAEGYRITAEAMPRANGVLWGLTTSFNPFSFRPSMRAIADLPLEERVRRMRDPAFKAKVLAEPSSDRNPTIVYLATLIGDAFVLGDPADYEQPPENTIANRAKAKGVDTLDLAWDMLLEDEGRSILYLPSSNYLEGNYDNVLEMIRHPNVLPSLGDGGAHYGLICDASYSTFMLTHWVRDRTRGEKLPLAFVVEALSRRPAEAFGLTDRGVIAPGKKADLNVIDLDNLVLPQPEVVQDLPSGGKRTVQRARGYAATVVSGEVTYRDSEPTGNLPGRLVRRTPVSSREEMRVAEPAE